MGAERNLPERQPPPLYAREVERKEEEGAVTDTAEYADPSFQSQQANWGTVVGQGLAFETYGHHRRS